MNSISKTEQSYFLCHFLKTLNWFSFKRWLLPWASTKCRPIAEYLCTRHLHQRTRSHWETINNALGLRSCPNFLLPKTGCSVGRILWLRSRNYFRTTLAATLSLNGGLILTVLLSSMFLSAVPAEAFLKKRIIVSRIKKRKMVDFLMKWIRIGQAAHPQLNYKDIDNQGGLPYKSGGFRKVSSPYHTVKPV